MNENVINAAAFISVLEQAVRDDEYLESFRKVLLRDMPEILDDMKLTDEPDSGQIIIKRKHPTHHITVSTRDYVRDYAYSGAIYTRTWLRGNMIHSYEDNPASISYYCYDGGRMEAQTWFKENELHRSGGKPAQIVWHPNGKLAIEEFREDGKKHRTGNLPAYTHYEEDGSKDLEEWAVKTGGSGRTDGGPAYINYGKD